jgi:RNA polymerase sigma-70 factor (ECF subfamily)
MPEGGGAFVDFICRIRNGDAQAAVELVQQYESAIRREVRLRMRDDRLRRVFDSMDVCQSVLASFFPRAAAGQYDLDQPEQLLRLLVSIARNKVAYQARQHHAQRRDQRRSTGLDHAAELPDADPTPSQVVAGRELWQTFRDRLTGEERQLADLRAQGKEWAEIAALVGGTAQARRRQLSRAADRVALELGLDDGEPDVQE